MGIIDGILDQVKIAAYMKGSLRSICTISWFCIQIENHPFRNFVIFQFFTGIIYVDNKQKQNPLGLANEVKFSDSKETDFRPLVQLQIWFKSEKVIYTFLDASVLLMLLCSY